MFAIQKPAIFFEKLFGKQSIKENLSYRLLNYVVLVQHGNANLLFNNLTKELLLLSDAETETVRKNSISFTDEAAKTLIEQWFLVPLDFDDSKLRNQALELTRLLQSKKYITLYDIVTTTACNARCFYCFEAGTKPYSMTEKTARDVIRCLKDYYNGKTIHINWFGGEPLCNTRVIDIISNGLAENNINFMSTMTTNGSLFNRELAEHAVSKWKLKSVQITLDGMEQTYNKVKAYKNMGENPFQKVIGNISCLLEVGISVMVRLNVDEYNIEETYQLVDFLAGKYSSYPNFSVYAHLLFEDTGFIKTTKSQQQRDDMAEKYLQLCEYIDNLGLRKRKPLENKIATYFCLADNPEGVLISATGLMSRCENSVEGAATHPVTNASKLPVWDKYCPSIDRCEKCAYYPSCLRLSDCPRCSRACEIYEQKLHLKDLNKQIIAAYEDYRNANK